MGKEYNFMIKEESTINGFLKGLVSEKSISKSVYDDICCKGASPARLYGLAKIHKDLINGIPKFRPIISQIGSPTYNLAKFLTKYITPLTSNEYTIKDSFEFSSNISSQDHSLFMASLDVDSLFTNIPLDETITITVNKIYGRKRKIDGIKKSDFREMLNFATKGSIFYFNGNYFRQVDGVAMGSPLGPALANMFLSHHEVSWIKNCPSTFSPKFYKRYVDDIFVLMHSEENLLSFLGYMNTKHPNISFTHELEKNNSMPFLDIHIYRANNSYNTSIHRKSTFSGVYTHFLSFMPIEYKRGLICTLLYRSFALVSSYENFHLEVVKLKEIINKNGYPVKVIDNCISKFLTKKFEIKSPVQTAAKKEINLFLPYLGKTSLALRTNLIKAVSKSLPFCYKVRVVFKSSNRLSSYFGFKDKIPQSLISGVVYKYQCSRCNLAYIGKTVRYFETRLSEHLSISALTGKPLKTFQKWPPMSHSLTCKSDISRDDFSIIGHEKNDYLLKIKESLAIYECNPSLNNRSESTKLYLFN